MRAARRGLLRPDQAWLLLWVLVGLLWLTAALQGWAQAPTSQRRVFVLPVLAGVLTTLTGGWALASELRRRGGSAGAAGPDAAAQPDDAQPDDAPPGAGPGTLLDVLLLGSLMGGAWLLMPVLGLVLTAVALFLALCLVYRDLGWKGTTANLLVLFVLLAYGAGELLNMPLMRSRYLTLPF